MLSPYPSLEKRDTNQGVFNDRNIHHFHVIVVPWFNCPSFSVTLRKVYVVETLTKETCSHCAELRA